MPRLDTMAALALSAGWACFLSRSPPVPVAMVIMIRAGIQAYVSYQCRTRNPQKEMRRESTPMMTMPAAGVRLPEETAERHWPPTTQMMTMKPVKVARLRRTGMDTRYRLGGVVSDTLS